MIQPTAPALSTLQDVLSAVDRTPTAAAYMKAARDLTDRHDGLAPVRVALLSSFTLDLVRPYLQVELARQRLGGQLYLAPFSTIAQELLDPGSGTAKHTPDVVFIAERLGDVLPTLADAYLALTAGEVEALTSGFIAETVARLEAFRSRSSAAVVYHSFTLPAHPLLGIAEAATARSQTNAIRDVNARLHQAVSRLPGIYWLDCDRAAATVGYRQWYDDKMWHMARAPLSVPALIELARTQAAFAQAILGTTAKCVVLDLDNTLWGGVIGEAGIGGIQLGDRFPGSAYRDFQRALLSLHHRGVLLAINSKNNPDDVARVFEDHPHAVLRREHFAAIRVNWQPKPENMRAIAGELNLGLDALAFFDDNPAERALMRQALPQVRTLEVPADPLRYTQTLDQSRIFDRLHVSDEDRQRGRIYQAQQQRRHLEAGSASLESFLESLAMQATIDAVSAETLPRLLDLVQKTNQFNLTTRRHSAGDLARMAADPAWGLFTLRLQDRFGDQGIVGVAIVSLESGTAVLDTLLLSCRVIGRNVETTLLAFVAEWARRRGAQRLDGVFIPSAKNAPASDFFERHGFVRVDAAAVDSAVWRLPLEAGTLPRPPYITCNVSTEP